MSEEQTLIEAINSLLSVPRQMKQAKDIHPSEWLEDVKLFLEVLTVPKSSVDATPEETPR